MHDRTNCFGIEDKDACFLCDAVIERLAYLMAKALMEEDKHEQTSGVLLQSEYKERRTAGFSG